MPCHTTRNTLWEIAIRYDLAAPRLNGSGGAACQPRGQVTEEGADALQYLRHVSTICGTEHSCAKSHEAQWQHVKEKATEEKEERRGGEERPDTRQMCSKQRRETMTSDRGVGHYFFRVIHPLYSTALPLFSLPLSLSICSFFFLCLSFYLLSIVRAHLCVVVYGLVFDALHSLRISVDQTTKHQLSPLFKPFSRSLTRSISLGFITPCTRATTLPSRLPLASLLFFVTRAP